MPVSSQPSSRIEPLAAAISTVKSASQKTTVKSAATFRAMSSSCPVLAAFISTKTHLSLSPLSNVEMLLVVIMKMACLVFSML